MQPYSPAIEAALDGVAEHLRHARSAFITGRHFG
jgi:hypothetical protein